ncbi:hypothetical protein E2C01_094889 [Portunus trituberculatus]|uniref:Uncharacterized protein n=1 Tax=Portunus trituberculatus TaxID=210409 RepID=A0A5B7K4D2_PORTR|nr:hypothetical protein [Portunus trituberculatus]
MTRLLLGGVVVVVAVEVECSAAVEYDISPTYTRTVDRIRTRALEDPSDPKVRMVTLYHGGPVLSSALWILDIVFFFNHTPMI